MTKISFILSSILFASVLPAQTSEVGKRSVNQQDRIANGVQSGELTAGETGRLETKDARINKEVRTDRAANGGRLTGAEKGQVNRQDNRVSKQIYADKHNAATAKYGNNKVGARRENQQDRIAQGVRSGSLKPGQTARLENKESGINKEVGGERKANGGNLTNNEKRQVNRQQNQVSGAIYKDKHS